MRTTLATLLLLTCTAAGLAESPFQSVNPSRRPRLKSIYSTIHDVEEFSRGGKQGIVLIFLGTHCPVAQQYVPRLNELCEHDRAAVQFLGVFSDSGVNVQSMAAYAHDEDICFPVVQDVDHRLADLLEVQSTPEVVVLDRNLEKIYQGAIDDQFKRHGRKSAAGENYLQEAIGALLEGERPERSYVPASGCPLERSEARRSSRALTYHKDVAPLVQKHCQECHRADGAAPFELTSFDDVASNREKIREVVSDRRMPPWHGILNPEFGELKHSKQLSSQEIAAITDWIDGGAPEGDPADAPPPVRRSPAGEWVIGQPDFVYRMPKPFQVPKSGTLEYQFFRVPLGLNEDRWFRGVEIKPGIPDVVHHITLHVAPAAGGPQRFDGLTTMAQLYGLNGERAQVLSDYVPGDLDNAKTYPADQAVLIPKNSDLIFEVHYTPNNRQAASDQSMAGFVWADAPPLHPVHTKIFRKAVGQFRIPPHDPHYRAEDTYYFEHDVLIDSIRPHFHLRGKSYRLEIVERNPETDEIQRRRTILSVPVYDPAWQRTYELATPLHLAAGTELVATGHYDNSSMNPNNPDPSATVLWGQQMWDEMFSTRFKYRLAEAPAK